MLGLLALLLLTYYTKQAGSIYCRHDGSSAFYQETLTSDNRIIFSTGCSPYISLPVQVFDTSFGILNTPFTSATHIGSLHEFKIPREPLIHLHSKHNRYSPDDQIMGITFDGVIIRPQGNATTLDECGGYILNENQMYYYDSVPSSECRDYGPTEAMTQIGWAMDGFPIYFSSSPDLVTVDECGGQFQLSGQDSFIYRYIIQKQNPKPITCIFLPNNGTGAILGFKRLSNNPQYDSTHQRMPMSTKSVHSKRNRHCFSQEKVQSILNNSISDLHARHLSREIDRINQCYSTMAMSSQAISNKSQKTSQGREYSRQLVYANYIHSVYNLLDEKISIPILLFPITHFMPDNSTYPFYRLSSNYYPDQSKNNIITCSLYVFVNFFFLNLYIKYIS